MFKNIEQMKRNRQKVIREAREIVNKAGNEKRNLSTWEQDKYDDLMDEVKSMDEEINEEERSQQEEMKNSAPRKGTASIGPEYRNVFKMGDGTLDKGNFESFGDFLKSVESGRSDPRLEKLDTRNALNTGVGAEGGFTVPTEYASFLVDGSLEEEVIRPRANVFPMTSMQRKVPSWDNLDRSSGLYGGINAQWTAELQERADQQPALREITLEAVKLILYVSASREVVQDGAELEQELTKAIRKALSHEMDKAFLAGSGSGEPQGILNSPALISVNRQEASQVQYQDLVNMYSQLVKGGRPIWVASHSVIPQLMTMESTGNNLIWQPNARDGSPGQLLGMPVYLSDKVPALGTRGDLMLVDPSRYMVGMRQDIALDVSQGPGWYRDYTSWRCVLRVAGQGAWDKPMTLSDGATQLSPFVALDVA